jgi:hypothetical protein
VSSVFKRRPNSDKMADVRVVRAKRLLVRSLEFARWLIECCLMTKEARMSGHLQCVCSLINRSDRRTTDNDFRVFRTQRCSDLQLRK